MPTGWTKDPWHLDVVLDSGTYYAFMTLINYGTTGGGEILWLYTSADGDTFTAQADYVLIPSRVGWDNARIYRATAIKTAGGFDLWYSAVSSGNAWKIGKTTVTL
jgi:hypothetical protein